MAREDTTARELAAAGQRPVTRQRPDGSDIDLRSVSSKRSRSRRGGVAVVGNALFISYGHKDMVPVNWLERLKMYLAPFRRQDIVDIWDDTRIRVGNQWRSQIKDALDRAVAAILLIGPGFVASEFIVEEEVSALLAAASNRGLRVYPLVIGYCAYKRSVLEPYQAFNDPETPLEALPTAEQNRILNALSLAVDQDMRHLRRNQTSSPAATVDFKFAMKEIIKLLRDTRTAFVAQCQRRDELVLAIRRRLKVNEMLEYENFFFRYHSRLTAEERFQFEQIRAMTEGPMHDGNQTILEIIEQHRDLMDQLPALADLRQHLVFWLNKYDRVFVRRPEMCLLYTGVEDGVPFPSGVEEQVEDWLRGSA